MGPAEDGNAHHYRPHPTSPEQDDALDDAPDVCLYDSAIPQWPVSLLGNIEHYHYRHPVLYRGRLGGFVSQRGSQETTQGKETQETHC